ncbi:hypothetical protein Cgig2_024135 [Carnegiea gigantea]|uniref:Transposase-associated domain-containing protein n=1 Tax=Carnegiea gigantea TaxID=171969 RepID=A0A9Q1GXU5_9CARY|nr:hypothetical protein Cgig2_024135 [Carnegiea gigantea]
MVFEMDSSWIELPNDHLDYLDGAVKFIKLAKENLVEGRTRCPCRRCKVDKWLPIEEVEQHILFKGDILGHVKYRGSTSREINIDPPNFTSGDDMEGLLRATFGVDMPRSKRTLNVPGAKSSTAAAQSLGHPTSNAAPAEPAELILPPPGTRAGASKLIVQQRPVGLSRSTGASKPLPQQLLQPTPSSGASQLPLQPFTKKSVQHATSTRASIEPCLQLQPTASIPALQPVRTPISPNGVTQPLIRPSTIKFGPFQLSATGSNLPCQPPSLVGTSQVNPSTIGLNQPSQPPPVIGTSQSKFVYPADKCFDKRVLKHVTKHFKQHKYGLKKDYFKPEQKTKEAMYELVPKGTLTLAEIGRDARALQTHCHTTGSTSYAEKRANFTEASAKVQERLLSSSPSKTQVEIENEVFDELMYEEENPKRPIGFGFNVDQSDVFDVNSILRKRGYIFPDNNMELKRVKEELASQKAMFLLMLKAVRNGKITDEFLDATEVALRMAGDQVSNYYLELDILVQVPQESSGNSLSNESAHAGPSTSASQVN